MSDRETPKSPRQALLNMPQIPLLPSSVDDDGANWPENHPRDRINDGEHPFVAISEDQGYTALQTAKMMDMDIEEYMLIIKDRRQLRAEEVLKFCEIFQCMPYDLASDFEPLPPAIRDAALLYMNDLNGTLSEEQFEELYAVLTEDACNENTIDEIDKLKKQARARGQSHNFVVEFLN